MKNILISALIALSLVVSSCGSIINGSTQDIIVNTTPKEVTLKITAGVQTIYNKKVSTPVELELERSEGYFEKARYNISISAPGYETLNFTIKGKVSGWYIAGNIFFGGLIGWLIVDPATGGMWRLTPEDINTSLNKDQVYFNMESKGLNIMLKQDLPEEVFNKLTEK